MKTPVKDFIKNHKHINYCEAIIYKDGSLEYAEPSHTEALIRITGESKENIYKKMPIDASPIVWLTQYTGCIPVWSNGFMRPQSCTKDQEKAVDQLINNCLVNNNLFQI